MRISILLLFFILFNTTLIGQYEECGIINGDSTFRILNSLLSGDGNTLAVVEQGSISRIRIFEVRENQIIEKGSIIDPFEPLQVFHFGRAICMSHEGNRIGAIGTHDEDGSFMKIFDYVNGEWIQKGNAIIAGITNTSYGDGISMSKDGNVIAVGHYDVRVGSFYRSGYVDIYEFDSITDNWLPKGDRIEGNSADSYFGECLDLSDDGDRIIIGSPSSRNKIKDGFVKIFDFINEEWVLYDDLANENDEHYFGFYCALNGEGNIATTCVQNSDGSLNLLITKLNTLHPIEEIWEYQFPHQLMNESTNDNLKISDNGKIISFGVYGRDTSSFSIGRVGKIGVYQQNDNGDWIELSGIDDPRDQNFVFGESISMSNDGSKIAVYYSNQDGSFELPNYVKLYFNKDITATSILIDSESKDIYPNPTDGIINLPIIEEQYNMIEIWDNTGKLMFSSSSITSSTLDVSHFNPGIYYLHLQTKNGAIHIQRFVKE